MIHKTLPTPFPFYDRQEDWQKNRKTSGLGGGHSLIAPANGTLPFQFRKPQNSELPTAMYIRLHCDNTIKAVCSNWLPTLQSNHASKEGFDYFWLAESINALPYRYGWQHVHVGTTITSVWSPFYLNLLSGFYYTEIVFPSGSVYSEIFEVPEDRFKWNDQELSNYIKISWTNDGDLRPLLYGATPALIGFQNVCYLIGDATITDPQYEVEEAQDSLSEPYPIMQKMSMKWIVSSIVPEFLKKALSLLPLHDTVTVWRPLNLGEGVVKNVEFNSANDPGGALATVDIKYEDLMVSVKVGCPTELSNSPCPSMPANIFFNILNPTGGYKFFAIIPPNCYAVAYGAYSNTGPWNVIPAYLTAVQLLNGIFVLHSPSDYDWFYLSIRTFTCIVGDGPVTHKI